MPQPASDATASAARGVASSAAKTRPGSGASRFEVAAAAGVAGGPVVTGRRGCKASPRIERGRRLGRWRGAVSIASITSRTPRQTRAPSRISAKQPWALGRSASPGTASSGRPSRRVAAAVDNAPLRSAASTTTVADARAAIRRLRRRNVPGHGHISASYSLTSAPRAAMRAARSSWLRGVITSSPAGSTAAVTPEASSAPSCAAASIPRARPLTTAQPSRARSAASTRARSRPYGVDAREPTIATARRGSGSAPRT